ncbi:MAG: O-succinylhomoserine sulfhydrylase [Alphaproteobacteria bacterium]|nr:O-succinylhomoserine sulfhydrylase [Alphaproteobacteria bacterium]
MKDEDWHQNTNLVHAGTARSNNNETSEALFMSSGFIYENAEQAAASFRDETDNFVYSRYGNPTVRMLEERLAKLEGAETCRATGTGMAAVFAALACQLSKGDRVVASRALFGACYSILAKILPGWGIEVVFVNGGKLDEWEHALSVATKVVFLETPSNPLLQIIDLEVVCNLAKKAGANVIVDNVFATPLYQKPLQLGADIVTYSATKHIDGQGRLLAGAVLGNADFMTEQFLPFYRQTGPTISAFNAWIMLKSLETLSVRVERQTQNAASIAATLSAHPKIKQIFYPGLPSHPDYEVACRQMSGAGSIVAFELMGGRENAFAFLNALNLILISNNLGDAKSLITHPTTTTHQNLSEEERAIIGITEGHLRLSAGLEHKDDLNEDILQALKYVS